MSKGYTLLLLELRKNVLRAAIHRRKKIAPLRVSEEGRSMLRHLKGVDQPTRTALRRSLTGW
jgi:hypothetical protein